MAMVCRKTIVIFFYKRDLTTNELTKPRINNGNLPSTDSYGNWLLPSTLPAAPQQLLLLYKDYIVYSLNISSPSDWMINKKLSDITLDFLSKSLSFHMDMINSTTIAVADDQMNIYIYIYIYISLYFLNQTKAKQKKHCTINTEIEILKKQNHSFQHMFNLLRLYDLLIITMVEFPASFYLAYSKKEIFA